MEFKFVLSLTLLGIRSNKLQALRLLKLIPEFIPCINQQQNKYHTQDVITHSFWTANAVAQLSYDPILRFTALIHDIGKPQTAAPTADGFTFYNHHNVGAELSRVICQRLSFSSEDIERVYTLIRHHCRLMNPPTTVPSVRRLIRSLGTENLGDLFILCSADMLSDCPPSLLLERVRSYETTTQYIKKVVASLKEECPSPPLTKNLILNGNDVMRILQISPGPEVGRALHRLQAIVNENPDLNNSPDALTQTLLSFYRNENASSNYP
jgi:tRNA nucleotidyltransferase (CCA-adding enzyme)